VIKEKKIPDISSLPIKYQKQIENSSALSYEAKSKESIKKLELRA
jgi:hypothetical protein